MLLAATTLLFMLAGCRLEKKKTEVHNPLVVGYSAFEGKFSPFFAETAEDRDVVSMTQLNLLTSDRQGAVVLDGIRGETVDYNGTPYTYYGPASVTIISNDDTTVEYRFTLREDITFSDGTPLTVDDVLFSLYVLCDPTYNGSSALYTLPIAGLQEYRAGMAAKWQLILADTPKAAANGSAQGYYTADEAATFWAAFGEAGRAFVQEIVKADTAAGVGKDMHSIAQARGYTLAAEATESDWFAAMVDKYGYDLSDKGINSEKAGSSFVSLLTARLSEAHLRGGVIGDSANTITGIRKTGQYTFSITLERIDATAIYELASVPIAPLHYYGSAALYDYENHQFGFVKGDLSGVRQKNKIPLGAGMYRLTKYQENLVTFQSNTAYYRGAPRTKNVQFKVYSEAGKLDAIATGSVHITQPSFDKNTIATIKQVNGGVLNGDKIAVSAVDYLGYGCMGMSAHNVKVGDNGGSAASKNLRRALATVFAVYRKQSVNHYYGERATVIEYPISDTSWAAPQVTEEGYHIAFSTDVNGNEIYTEAMTAEERYTAAQQAALGFLEAAGYVVRNGKVTAAPRGAKLSYSVRIPAGGNNDHPMYELVMAAKKSLQEIGIQLTVSDVGTDAKLLSAIKAETAEIWCAAWDADIDPDMYPLYFSGDAEHPAGTLAYVYDIQDTQLNTYILQARSSLDRVYRRRLYKQALDIVVDWAVEVPVYQRQEAVLFRNGAVVMSTVTPDITPFYGWLNGIHTLRLAGNS